MTKKVRLHTFAGILLLSLVLFMASSQRANAWFFDPFENMVEMSLQTMENIVLGLSDDIGSMADNIGIMADRILVMADKIGEMSDRIVYTEELMVSAISDSGISSLITSPVEGTYVNIGTPVDITLSSQKTEYLLYISNNADMSGATNALVQNGDTSIAWSRLPGFVTGSKIYIAVKTVGGTSSSEFSNTVMLNLQ